jgi:hypothetical protein
MAKKYDPVYNKKKLLIALKKKYGIVSQACEAAGLVPSTFYTYYKTDPVFAKEVDEIQDIVLDFVESKLFEKIEGGSEKSILFYMRYKAKKRGYTDNIDITSNGEKLNNVQIEIIKRNNEKE